MADILDFIRWEAKEFARKSPRTTAALIFAGGCITLGLTLFKHYVRGALYVVIGS